MFRTVRPERFKFTRFIQVTTFQRSKLVQWSSTDRYFHRIHSELKKRILSDCFLKVFHPD